MGRLRVTIRFALLATLALAAAAPGVASAQVPPPTLTIDTAFAPPAGIARDDFGTGVVSDTPLAIAVDAPRGRIYVVGESGSTSTADVAVVARRFDGTLDTGFAGTGKLTVSTSNGRDTATDIAVLPDGRLRVLATSNSSNPDVALLGFTPGGAPDTALGPQGRVALAIGSGTDVAARMAFDGRSRLAIVGCTNAAVGTNICSGTGNSGDSQFVTLRNAEDGTIATGFASDASPPGVVKPSVAGSDRGVDVAFRPGGGVVTLAQEGTNQATLRAFTDSGANETAFAGGAVSLHVVGETETVAGGLIAHGGALYATGSTKVAQDTDAFVARVRPDGSRLEARRFDMRGRLVPPSQAVLSRGTQLAVVDGAEPTLVVAGTLDYATGTGGSSTDWAAAAFQGLGGTLESMRMGDFSIGANGAFGLAGVADGPGGSAAVTGPIDDGSGGDRGFGTSRLLIDADKTCDLALALVEPLELMFAGTDPASVTLRATNAGTRPCGGSVAAPDPYQLHSGGSAGAIGTGVLPPGGSATLAGAQVTYGGPRRRDDVVVFTLSSPDDANSENNSAAIRAVFSYCDARLSTAGRVRALPNEGAWPVEFSVTNVGTSTCRVQVEAVSGARTSGGETFEVQPGRSVSERVRVALPRRRASNTRQLVFRVRAEGDVDGGNDRVTLSPTIVRVGDSNARKPRGRVRGFSGVARRGRGDVRRKDLDVRRVSIAVRRVGRKCRWLASSRGRFRTVRARRGRCDRPVWLRAKGTRRWSYRLARTLPAGRYVLMSRTTIRAGFSEASFTARDKNRISFRVRR